MQNGPLVLVERAPEDIKNAAAGKRFGLTCLNRLALQVGDFVGQRNGGVFGDLHEIQRGCLDCRSIEVASTRSMTGKACFVAFAANLDKQPFSSG